jgi:muramidase (phage lysozyme)
MKMLQSLKIKIFPEVEDKPMANWYQSQSDSFNKETLKRLIVGGVSVLSLLWLLLSLNIGGNKPRSLTSTNIKGTQPLVMKGGDPYIRALMRSISASEANDPQPYAIIYGGQHVSDLSHHPNRCVPIFAGPNFGNCSTAAGRYQMLNTTWEEKAQRYHPHPSGLLFWKSYSFEPEFQDAVVHAWLNDPQAWGVNLAERLRQGKLNEVRRRLSGTWTSLGYGIESNSMTGQLPKIYQQMLREELQQ